MQMSALADGLLNLFLYIGLVALLIGAHEFFLGNK
jgi:hypothetical protein